ncbi:MAG: N,N-dimethylformamidase beta subunit family domain-containing protein [Quisquiliibacterium sp.]
MRVFPITAMEPVMLPLAAYAERLSARPGETLRFHVANATGGPVNASVVRVLCADPNPQIGGVQTEPVAIPVTTLAEPGPQPVPLGSYAALGNAQLLAGIVSFSFSVTFKPTLALSRRQVLASSRVAGADGFEIELSPTQTVRATVATTAGDAIIESSAPVPMDSWSHLALVVDAERGVIRLEIGQPGSAQTMTRVVESLPGTVLPGSGLRRLSLASASADWPVDCFNGLLERPSLIGKALPQDESTSADVWAADQSCLGSWDFSREMHTQRLTDLGPNGQHGDLFNTPTRAMRGANWSGEEHCYRHAPDQYGAIHFHEDDLDDCRWPATHQITIPQDLKSDAYALILRAGDITENVPFFVVPPRGRANAKIAVLVSTFTYTIYGNHARPEWMTDPKWRQAYVEQARQWNAYPYNPGEHRDYALSTYNYHTDGSGVGMVTWRRPMLNLRLGYITYPYPEIRGSGLRHYPADSHLLMWLTHQGHQFDLITDAELHEEGLELLSRYKVLITGSHPEYHTGRMLDALQAYRDSGGRLVYLGGNGFYWKIALDPQRDGLVEIRRGEGGIRAWAAEPGEYYNQFDGQYGGLWRRNARPPQKLVGVGFTAQGNFVGSHYRIDPAARSNPKVNWILDGVEAATVGGEGFSGHGAAGFELDRVDKRLGSPASAVVIASSEDHPPEAPWMLVPEEQLTHITTIPGKTHKELIRADMTWFDCPGGGEVFSVGSITFCGSLPVNRFDNDISRILDNVVRRFSR